MSELYLNVANRCANSKALGIGLRYVIWVQGCPFNCKNCISEDWIPFKKANLISLSSLAIEIINQPKIDGITISGGEPMMQAKNLSVLLLKIKEKRPELNVIVFTGFELEKLKEWNDAKEFMKYIDVLITGVYIDRLNNNKGLRGSSNQKIIFLTDKLIRFKTFFEEGERKLEVFDKGSHLQFVGIPNKGYKK